MTPTLISKPNGQWAHGLMKQYTRLNSTNLGYSKVDLVTEYRLKYGQSLNRENMKYWTHLVKTIMCDQVTQLI